MSHEVESKFGFTCPNSTGSFYVCEDKPVRFVGCCTVDPCKTDDGNCPDDELVQTSFDQLRYHDLLPQTCVSNRPEVQWFTCAFNDPPFMGCCSSNPCAEGECPDEDLFAAALSENQDEAAALLPEGYFDDDGLSTGATAGIAVGASVGGVAMLAAVGFWFWRRRKGRKAAAAATASPSAYEPNGGQFQGGNSPHQTMGEVPMDKQFANSQTSPYAPTFVSSPSMNGGQHPHAASHLSWDGSQSHASFVSPSPYLPGQSPPMTQNGFSPSAYGGGAYQQYYQQQHQQQQQQHFSAELPGGGDGEAGSRMRPSELASTAIPEDDVSRVTSPAHDYADRR